MIYILLIFLIIDAFIFIHLYLERKKDRKEKNERMSAQAPGAGGVQVNGRCPYCGDEWGMMPAGKYCCSECRRTVVIGRAPTEEETLMVRRETDDISRIASPEFDLDRVKEKVYMACMEKPEFTFIRFTANHAEYSGENPRRIVDYPPLETAAGLQKLTRECLAYVKGKLRVNNTIIEYKEGYGWFDFSYRK